MTVLTQKTLDKLKTTFPIINEQLGILFSGRTIYASITDNGQVGFTAVGWKPTTTEVEMAKSVFLENDIEIVW